MTELEKKNKEFQEEIEKLKKQVKILKAKKKYGLVWEADKEPEQIVLDCQYKIPILKDVKTKEIYTNKEKPINILIEGDNYHALSVLNYTHKDKIDVIYIDPPFNTGARDWKYNNNFVDAEDPYRHSKWLCMMEKRLRLAKNLLKNTGIIIIAIDDYELFTLGLMADEIFTEKNRIGIIPVRNNPPGRAISKYFATSHEYYLFYAKNINNVVIQNLPIKEIDKNKYPYKDNISFYRRKSLSMRGHGSLEERPNNYFPIYVNIITKEISLIKIQGFLKILPHIGKDGKQRVWDYPNDSMKKLIEDGDIDVVREKNGNISIYKKDRINKGMRPKSLWLDAKYDSSAYGAVLLKKMFNDNKIFDYPKSLYAVIDAIFTSSNNNKDITILDFFAGSGTTGHATLELNKEDNGNRTFILCTNNESNICTEVCYPRIEKVINGMKNFNGKNLDGLGGNLKYFKTELLDIEHISHITDEQKIKLTYKAGEMIALREITFEEVEKNEWWQIFKDGTKYTAIYFKEDKKKLYELAKKLSKLNQKVVLYIFSWGKNEYKDEFAAYKNIKVDDIPEPIIDVYKEVNRLG